MKHLLGVYMFRNAYLFLLEADGDNYLITIIDPLVYLVESNAEMLIESSVYMGEL